MRTRARQRLNWMTTMVMDGPAERKTWTHDTPGGSGTGTQEKGFEWMAIHNNEYGHSGTRQKSSTDDDDWPKIGTSKYGTGNQLFWRRREVHTQTSYNDGRLIRPLSGLDLSFNRQRNRLIPSHTVDDVIQF